MGPPQFSQLNSKELPRDMGTCNIANTPISTPHTCNYSACNPPREPSCYNPFIYAHFSASRYTPGYHHSVSDKPDQMSPITAGNSGNVWGDGQSALFSNGGTVCQRQPQSFARLPCGQFAPLVCGYQQSTHYPPSQVVSRADLNVRGRAPANPKFYMSAVRASKYFDSSRVQPVKSQQLNPARAFDQEVSRRNYAILGPTQGLENNPIMANAFSFVEPPVNHRTNPSNLTELYEPGVANLSVPTAQNSNRPYEDMESKNAAENSLLRDSILHREAVFYNSSYNLSERYHINHHSLSAPSLGYRTCSDFCQSAKNLPSAPDGFEIQKYGFEPNFTYKRAPAGARDGLTDKEAQYLEFVVDTEDITQIPSTVFKGRNRNLNVLKLIDTKISNISPRISCLQRIVSLTIRQGQLTQLENLEQLVSLRKLDVGENHLTSIPTWISRLTNLQILCVDRNQINMLPRSIELLTNLRLLDVSHNNLTNFKLKALTCLSTLKVDYNSISITLPDMTFNQSLSYFSFSHNNVEKLTRRQLCLPDLTYLDGSNNSISHIHSSISCLQGLLVLNLENNQLDNLPPELYALSNLKNLNLSHNKIPYISPQIKLFTSMTCLCLSSNRLDYLPYQIASLCIPSIDIRDNPFKSFPKEVCKQGEAAMINFLKDPHGKVSWRRMKLMFVGNSNIGKTSLRLALTRETDAKKQSKHALINNTNIKDKLRRRVSLSEFNSKKSKVSNRMLLRLFGKKRDSLRYRTYSNPDELTTVRGIEIQEWTVNVSDYIEAGSFDSSIQTIQFSCYDFAGENIYYPTHSLFVTPRSIFLIVFNLLDVENSKVEYWLETVKLRAGSSSFVIIVGTHKDKSCDKKYVGLVLSKMKKKYYDRFPFIKGIVAVSCKTGSGISSLRRSLLSMATSHPTIKEKVPKSYILMESMIKSERRKRQTITKTEWEKIAEYSAIEPKNYNTCLKFMTDVGVFLHYNDRDNNDESARESGQKLEDIIILDPQWIIKLFSIMVTFKHSFVRDGIFECSCLSQLWKIYSMEIRNNFLNVLENFGIIYPLKKERYLVPSMLPSKPRGNTKELYRYFTSDLFSSGLHLWRKPMARLYQFRFLPLGFFGRLIFQVLQMPSIQVLGYWKRGVLIKSKRGEHCYCIYNDTTYELLIFVQVLSLGHEAGKEYAAFNALISCVDTLIDNNMYGRRLNIFVPCSHCIELDLPNPTLFPVESCILNMIDNAGQSLICLQSSPSIPPKRRSYLDFFSRKSQYRPQENLDEKRAAKKNRVPLSKLATDLALTSFSDRLVSFDQLCMGKKIAEGGFSTVYSATLLGKTVAVKMFHSHQQQSADFLAESFRELQHEVFLINQLRHANIVELRNFCTNPLCIIFDFYDLGSLNQYLVEKKKVFTWSERLRIALDIAEGLAYLHRQDMIHRDLRSHNILINSWDVRDMQVPVAKLTDFGLAAIICGSFQGVKEYNECWTAPEVMKRSRYSHKVDIYSFGIVCWELLQIGFPFQEYHEELGAPFRSELEEKIIGGLRPTIGKNVHPAYKNLIERCWQDKPEERPDGVELVHMLRAMIEENEQAPWDDS